MVGEEGAQAFRQTFLKLSSFSYTSITFWQSLPLFELKYWIEAAAADEVGDDNG